MTFFADLVEDDASLMSRATVASALHDAAEALTHVLEEENLALREGRTGDVAALHEHKAHHGRVYRDRMAAISQNPALLDGLTDDKRKTLRGLAQRLQSLGDENDRLLKANMEAISRYLRAMVNAVKGLEREHATYAPSGDLKGLRHTTRPTALSFNQTL